MEETDFQRYTWVLREGGIQFGVEDVADDGGKIVTSRGERVYFTRDGWIPSHYCWYSGWEQVSGGARE